MDRRCYSGGCQPRRQHPPKQQRDRPKSRIGVVRSGIAVSHGIPKKQLTNCGGSLIWCNHSDSPPHRNYKNLDTSPDRKSPAFRLPRPSHFKMKLIFLLAIPFAWVVAGAEESQFTSQSLPRSHMAIADKTVAKMISNSMPKSPSQPHSLATGEAEGMHPSTWIASVLADR